MIKINKQAFTLVELIVVITILAILGTIAFISLQGYSASARDSRRVSDISNIKKSLELFSINTGKYPFPDNPTKAKYLLSTIWTQGTVGDNIVTNLSRNLNKKPTDPLTEQEYTYSVTYSQTEYEVLAIYESDIVSYNYLPLSGILSPGQEKEATFLVSKTNAATAAYPKIDGTYNGVAVKTSKYIIPTPSIINAEIDENGIELSGTTIQSQIVTGGDNVIESSTGKLDIVTFEVYEIPANGVINNQEVGTIIQNTYSGSTDLNTGIYAKIVNTSDSSELVELVENIVISPTIFSTSQSSNTITTVNGECGTANKTYAYTESDYGTDKFCITGALSSEIPDFPTEGNPVTWDCLGTGSPVGTTIGCASDIIATPIDGVCGSAKDIPTEDAPSINLCTDGNTISESSSTSEFTWSCEGLNEGITVDCSTPRQYTVTFDKTIGDTVNLSSKVVTYNTVIGTLPITSKTGYTFDGWFTSSDGGSQITTGINIIGDVIYYAQWNADTKTFICSPKPSIGALWNTVNSYIQTWDGNNRFPLNSTTSYNITPSSTSCNYKCDSNNGYERDGSSCILNSYYECTTKSEIKVATSKYGICSSNDIIVCSGLGTGITIAACNVGTNTAGTTSSSYGNKYQFGKSDTSFIIGTNPYSYDWKSPGGTNAGSANYWGVYDAYKTTATYSNPLGNTNISLMQGPCADGYHIPTSAEWLLIHTAGGWLNNGLSMKYALKMPLSGYRDYDSYYTYGLGTYGYYWSSSPNGEHGYRLNFNNTVISPGGYYYRANGYAIRCFKN